MFVCAGNFGKDIKKLMSGYLFEGMSIGCMGEEFGKENFYCVLFELCIYYLFKN